MHIKMSISLPEALVIRIDEKVKEIGHGADRSGFIAQALMEYMDNNGKC